jgi:small subunit ribosomal protein S17
MAKQLIGIVTANKGQKTITVNVRTRKTHPLYRKQYTVSKKFLAHDEKEEAQPGDIVAISETRPISARKHHKLERILEKPKLRADSLAVTKTDEPEKPVSKKKTVEETPKGEEPSTFRQDAGKVDVNNKTKGAGA